eukprot:ctg_2398.g373
MPRPSRLRETHRCGEAVFAADESRTSRLDVYRSSDRSTTVAGDGGGGGRATASVPFRLRRRVAGGVAVDARGGDSAGDRWAACAGVAAKFRHSRAHRQRQDHAHRAGALLRRAHPQDPRSARQGRCGRHHGLDGTRARARYHHSVGGDVLLVAQRRAVEPDRHARPRRLHHRGGAGAAGAGRRRAGGVRCERRAIAESDGGPADEATSGAAAHLHQQTGSHGRGPVAGVAAAQRAVAHAGRLHQPAHRVGARSRGRGGCDTAVRRVL